jgi:hypothetical protein
MVNLATFGINKASSLSSKMVRSRASQAEAGAAIGQRMRASARKDWPDSLAGFRSEWLGFA